MAMGPWRSKAINGNQRQPMAINGNHLADGDGPVVLKGSFLRRERAKVDAVERDLHRDGAGAAAALGGRRARAEG